MKNRIKIIGIALIIAGSFSSCKEKDDVVPVENQPANSITVGRWKVSSFTVNGLDHTDFYKDYNLVFDKGGIVRATGAKEIHGLWARTNLNGNKVYRLYFGDTDPFNLLNSDNWVVVSQNDVALELEAQRGDDGKQTVSFSKQ